MVDLPPPPPELPPILAHLVDEPDDPVALAMAKDILCECGRGPGDCLPDGEKIGGWAGGDATWPLRHVQSTMANWLKGGPLVARWWPISVVTITDMMPYNANAAGGPTTYREPWWWTFGDPGESQSHVLPSPIFRLLEGGSKGWESFRDYATEVAANAALSRACLLWARLQNLKPT